MPEIAELTETRERFAAKQREMGEIFELASEDGTYDLEKKDVLEKLGATDSADALAKIQAKNTELDVLGEKLRHAQREQERSEPATEPVHDSGNGKPETKSLGQLYIESEEWKRFEENQEVGLVAECKIGLKTLFQTSAGFDPEDVRSGLIVPAATRPIQVLDLTPTAPISQSTEKYMEETTRTHAAAEKAEGVAYAESTFVFTEKTSEVRKVTDSLPVTDEQLEDAPEIANVLDQRLRFGLRQRLDGQVLIGDGTPPNLTGIVNVSGIQTQAKGTDPVFDACFKALTKIRVTGRASPNAFVLHPNDWESIRLTRTADGLYIMGPPSEVGPMSLFGLPVALSDALTENTGLAGDFANFCRIGERRGVDVQVGWSGTQFVEGKKTLRADLRAAFTVYRPAAFATITGI